MRFPRLSGTSRSPLAAQHSRGRRSARVARSSSSKSSRCRSRSRSPASRAAARRGGRCRSGTCAASSTHVHEILEASPAQPKSRASRRTGDRSAAGSSRSPSYASRPHGPARTRTSRPLARPSPASGRTRWRSTESGSSLLEHHSSAALSTSTRPRRRCGSSVMAPNRMASSTCTTRPLKLFHAVRVASSQGRAATHWLRANYTNVIMVE